jgi:hypothetical protein
VVKQGAEANHGSQSDDLNSDGQIQSLQNQNGENAQQSE